MIDVVGITADMLHERSSIGLNSERLYLGYNAYNSLRTQVNLIELNRSGHRESFGGLLIYLVHDDLNHIHVS